MSYAPTVPPGFSDASLSFTQSQSQSQPTQQSLSPSPTPPNDAETAKHRRNYQACEGCRLRKVKCDLGPVDAPHPPPCKRCRRENKQCDFADTRKKRHNDDPEFKEESENKRRRGTSASQGSASPFTQQNGGYGAWSSTDVGYNPSTLQNAPPNQSRSQLASPNSRPIPRSVTQLAMQGVKRESNDEVKSQAAEHLIADPITTSQKSFGLIINAANALEAAETMGMNPVERAQLSRKNANAVNAIPHRNRDGSVMNMQQLKDYGSALEVWNSMTFVRSGFFTADEAIAYVDYFYDNLQPMTPVVLPDYRDVSRHLELLTEEPILALTILTIASRYKQLKGFSATSRQYSIHEHLWKSLTSKVQRLLWGQEQFGGGGSGKVRELAGGQLTWTGSLRTLGTIEALLLLTDWQPRSLHFPPSNDDIRLLDKNFDNSTDNGVYANQTQTSFGPSDNTPYSSWLEPAWRSDRMSWMLLGLAEALSFELGVFDGEIGRGSSNDPDLPRKKRIRRMVTVYIAQTSGRIGIPSPRDFEDDYTGHNLEGPRIGRIDVMHGLWTHIAGIMHQANKQIFPSREYTMNLTRGNEYRDRIEHFAPLLQDWKSHFERTKDSIEPVMQCILVMEYEYARLYINSIGLQHVVESWVRPGPNSQSTSNMAKSVSENKRYIDEFTEAALHILDIVCTSMNQLGVLRNAPVRTFLRTLSAMMFTLKRLSMGNHERMVRKCIDLLEQVTHLLTTQVVDDVHLSASTARMIEGILGKVKTTMIRVQKPVNTSGAPSREHSRQPSPQHHAQHHDQQYMDHHNYNNNNNSVPASTTFDPLASIEARPMADLMDRTFIPPPNFNFQTNDFDAGFMGDAAMGRSVASDTDADWLALPLENITNKDNFQVDQGLYGIGPSVQGTDMLEALLNGSQAFDQSAMWGGGQEQHFQQF